MTGQTVTYYGSTATLTNGTIDCSCGNQITADTTYEAIATWMHHATTSHHTSKRAA